MNIWKSSAGDKINQYVKQFKSIQKKLLTFNSNSRSSFGFLILQNRLTSTDDSQSVFFIFMKDVVERIIAMQKIKTVITLLHHDFLDWLCVTNPSMEPSVLAAILETWCETVNKTRREVMAESRTVSKKISYRELMTRKISEDHSRYHHESLVSLEDRQDFKKDLESSTVKGDSLKDDSLKELNKKRSAVKDDSSKECHKESSEEISVSLEDDLENMLTNFMNDRKSRKVRKRSNARKIFGK